MLEILRAIPINDPLEKTKHSGLGQPLSKDIFLHVFNLDEYGFSQYHEPGQENSPFTFNFDDGDVVPIPSLPLVKLYFPEEKKSIISEA